jgi:hypothetical protein
MIQADWYAITGYDTWAVVSQLMLDTEMQRALLVVCNGTTHFLVLEATELGGVVRTKELASLSYVSIPPETAYAAALNHLCWLISGLK